MIALIILAAVYLIGVALFALFSSMMNHGWGNGYAIGPSIIYGAQWPWTLVKLAIKYWTRP